METIETLNARLKKFYGMDDTGRQTFRIVWSSDELEKRFVYYTPEGLELVNPVIKEVKKYYYAKDMYILEKLTPVPDMNKIELLELKLSYEPIWAYCDDNRNPMPPTWPATKFIIELHLGAMNPTGTVKYKEDKETPESALERIKGIQEELFGNETATGDALAYKEGVSVPSNYGSGQIKEK